MLNAELPCASDFCRLKICRLKKGHGTRVEAFILTSKSQEYGTTISNDRPLFSGGRNTGKLALMRQADGLYIAR